MSYDPQVSMAIPGFMEPEELQWLHDKAAAMSVVVEVGCWKGRSASALAAGCPGKVLTVDHFEGSPSEVDAAHAEAKTEDIYAIAQVNLEPYNNVTFMKMSSLQASRLFRSNSVDMVFLDGEHTRESVLVDLLAWYPKCSKLLCGHDADWEGVIGALALFGIPFERGPGSIWYMEFK